MSRVNRPVFVCKFLIINVNSQFFRQSCLFRASEVVKHCDHYFHLRCLLLLFLDCCYKHVEICLNKLHLFCLHCKLLASVHTKTSNHHPKCFVLDFCFCSQEYLIKNEMNQPHWISHLSVGS